MPASVDSSSPAPFDLLRNGFAFNIIVPKTQVAMNHKTATVLLPEQYTYTAHEITEQRLNAVTTVNQRTFFWNCFIGISALSAVSNTIIPRRYCHNSSGSKDYDSYCRASSGADTSARAQERAELKAMKKLFNRKEGSGPDNHNQFCYAARFANVSSATSAART